MEPLGGTPKRNRYSSQYGSIKVNYRPEPGSVFLPLSSQDRVGAESRETKWSQRISLLVTTTVVLVLAIMCPSQLVLTTTTLRQINLTTGAAGANSPRKQGHVFQVPFPHVNRAEYGTNPVAASDIVDARLFAPELLSTNTGNDAFKPLLKVPFPTGAFWTNLVIAAKTADQQLSYPIMVYPYGYKWNPTKLQVSYPASRRLMDQVSMRDIFNPDLTLTTVQDIAARYVHAFDPLSVTLRFNNSQTDNTKQQYWESYLVQGSPYVTLHYENVTPLWKPLSIFRGIACLDKQNCEVTMSDKTSVKLRGTHFVLKTQENWSWLVFASETVTLVFDSIRKTTVCTQDSFTGVMRLALVPPPQQDLTRYTSQFPSVYESVDLSQSSGVDILVGHANLYPTGANVSWDFPSNGTGRVSFDFIVKVMNDTTSAGEMDELLMLALPHHEDAMTQSASSGTKNVVQDFDLTYRSIKGHMTPIRGSKWSYNETLQFPDFDDELISVSQMDEGTKSAIMDQVAFDITRVLPTADENVYGYGKQVARLAQLVLIARTLGSHSHQELINDATKTLHKFVTAFLCGENRDIVVYDTNFGGIVTQDGLNDFMRDFGNGWYNDHHFHYGYHLYASAILGRWNSTFVDEHGAKVDALMYDVVHSSYGTSSDTPTTGGAFFPLARHKSWFDGHSFASGLFPFASGKSMESSSESVNCYYGAHLWAKVRYGVSRQTDRKLYIINFTGLLLAMEIRGIKTYWHMLPKSPDDEDSSLGLYNPIFSKNLMVGNLGMMDVTVSTWFGNNPLYVHMINFMPVTAITRVMFGGDFVEKELGDVIQPIYYSVEMAWKGYVVCDRALVDPNAAWNDALSLRSYELDQALSKAQVMYFISTTNGFSQSTSAVDDGKGKPTPGDSGEFKSSSVSSFCYDHPACAALSLTGMCCPSPGGANLLCCDAPTWTKRESDEDITATGESDSDLCSDNVGCAELGLTGLCCPTSGGAMLACCNKSS